MPAVLVGMTFAALTFAGACRPAPILPPPEPTFGIPEQQDTLIRWLEGDFTSTTAEGQEILWRIRNIPGFRAMLYMERFVEGSDVPDRQELWYVEPPGEEIRIQSWRHIRPHLFAGATGNPQRLANEYIYDMRRNEDINLIAQWQEGRFIVRTEQAVPPTGEAGHPDSRPILTLSVFPDRLMRAEQFTEGAEAGRALFFQRVTDSE